MPVAAQTEQHDIESRQRRAEAVFERLFVGARGRVRVGQRRRHRMKISRRNRHTIDQGIAGHAQIAARVVGRHVALVAPPDVQGAPVDRVAGRRVAQGDEALRSHAAAGQAEVRAAASGLHLDDRGHEPRGDGLGHRRAVAMDEDFGCAHEVAFVGRAAAFVLLGFAAFAGEGALAAGAAVLARSERRMAARVPP